MKIIHRLFMISLVLLNVSCVTQIPLQAQQGYVSTQIFYDQLSPYGDWIDNPNYGYIWIPDVDQSFSPYASSGHWVMTNYGWTWVSDYDWGWAPFHYGRWDFDDYYGWFWVPDNEWGPSWVTWRSGEGYYGWSPMRPGITVDLSFNNEYRENDHWNFVRDRDFGRSDISQYYIDQRKYNTVIMKSTVINNKYFDRRRNTTYVSGPNRENVQRETGRKVNNIAIRDNERPGQALNNNQLNLYRPHIKLNDDKTERLTPPKISKREDIKPVRERKPSDQQNKLSPDSRNNNAEQQEMNQPRQQTERPTQRPRQRDTQAAQPNEQKKQNQLPTTPQQHRQQGQQPAQQRQQVQQQQQNQRNTVPPVNNRTERKTNVTANPEKRN